MVSDDAGDNGGEDSGGGGGSSGGVVASEDSGLFVSPSGEGDLREQRTAGRARRRGAHRREVNRIILTRPAVEAGERLGFLPGDLMAKVDPYLRPLFDALHDMLDPETVTQHLERGVIEVAPLAFMRGRTLNDSFIILDEAQNTTPEQMKMFLTRLGFGSKMVVTGDVTQIDLPREQASGLIVGQRDPRRTSRGSSSSASATRTSSATSWCAGSSPPTTSTRSVRRPSSRPARRA